MPTISELLAELEDRNILGEILESDYKELKWKLMKDARDQGEEINIGGGIVQRAETRDSQGKVFCYVDAGPFMYGPDDEYAECKAAYYMSKYPVTVKEWLRFLDDTKYDYPEEDLAQMLLISPDHNCPAVHISYNDAKEYCRWMRRITNEYYSLPHEMEWEKAARGIDGRTYPWGFDPPTPEMACFQDDEETRDGTFPVTAFEMNRSPYGCVDMVGNVWEWCLDSIPDPREPHILRGGAWCNSIDFCNCLSRVFSFPPEKRIDFGGFRLVYLPHEENAEYRRQYGGGGAQRKKMSLKVVKLDKAHLKPVNRKENALASKLAAAAERAADEGDGQTKELAASIDSLVEEQKAARTMLDEARKQLQAARTGSPADAAGPAVTPKRLVPKAEVRRAPGAPESSAPIDASAPATDDDAVVVEGELDEFMAQALMAAASQFTKSKDKPKESLEDRIARIRKDAATAGEEEITFVDPEVEPGEKDGAAKSSSSKTGSKKSKGPLEFDELWNPGDSYEPIVFPKKYTTYALIGWAVLSAAILTLLFMRIYGF